MSCLSLCCMYVPGASSVERSARRCRSLVQPSDSEYLDCPPLVTTRLLNRNVNQPTNCPRYRRSTTCVLSLRHHQGTTHQRIKNTPSRSCVFMMDTAADDSELNQEHGRASEFVLSSTTKPFAAAVDGNADSHQRSTTNFNATSKDAAAVASLPSGVASSVTNVSTTPVRKFDKDSGEIARDTNKVPE